MAHIIIGSKKETFDATDSWHGYCYQGKVALLAVIERINDLYISDRQDEIPLFYLEIEWLEDFSIMYSTQDVLKYKSIHQVKAKKDSNIFNYADALESLAIKLLNYPEIDEAFLHTETEVSVDKKLFTQTIMDVIHKENCLTELLTETVMYLENDSFRDILCRQFEAGRSGRRTNYATFLLETFRRSVNDDKAKIKTENIREYLRDFKISLEQNLVELKTKIDESIITKVKLKEYVVNKKACTYCSTKDISILLENQIFDYYLTTEILPEVTGDKKFPITALAFLQKYLDDYISKRHTDEVSKTICFSEIEAILKDSSMIKRHKEFYIYNLKENFFTSASEYCQDCGNLSTVQCEKCYLPLALDKIRSFDNTQFSNFVLSTFIHSNHGMDNETGYKKLISYESGYVMPFFEMLEKKIPYALDKIPISYYVQNNKKKELHLLSTLKCLNECKSSNELNRLCRNIIENTNAVNTLYDYNAIICSGFPKTTLSEASGDFWTEITKSESENYNEHIYYLKDIQITEVKDYKEEVKI